MKFILFLSIPISLINWKFYLKLGKSVCYIDPQCINVLGLHFSKKSLKLLPFLMSLPEVINYFYRTDDKIQCNQCFLIVNWNPWSSRFEQLYQSLSDFFGQELQKWSLGLLNNFMPIRNLRLNSPHHHFISEAFEILFILR